MFKTRRIKAFAVLLLALLASCGGDVRDGPPPKEIDVSRIPNAIPKAEPIKRAGNKNPYELFGKTYYILPTAEGYRAKGQASWYGSKFHGRKTANGEVYDMYAMTAAHKTLPIPSYVEVRNLANDRTVIVRINDRGPFHGGRIIDLSYAAAKKLGFYKAGIADVEVISVSASSKGSKKWVQTSQPAFNNAAITNATASSSKNSPLQAFLQLGAFANADAAEDFRRQAASKTSHPVSVSADQHLFKVFVGPFGNTESLAAAKSDFNLPAFVVYQ